MSAEGILNPTPEELLTAERDVALASVTHWQQVAEDLERRCADAHREYSTLRIRAAAEAEASVREIVDRLGTAVRLVLDSDEHVVDVRETEFGLMHPFKCRPDILGCPVHRALTQLGGPRGTAPGRYLVTLDRAGDVVVGEPVAEGYDPIRLIDLLTVVDGLGGPR